LTSDYDAALGESEERPMSKVLVLDATYEDCARAVDEVFETFPLDVKGKSVVVKVNALKAGVPVQRLQRGL
jgi:hypothetical protein